ncbi:MAG: inorganic phosphate transporter, partial [Verrucomicrobia bacterium]|nr:inorganic phosphate transporter [Verrucomicrobiota bacterium]
SPLLSCLLTVMLYPALRWGRKVLHVERHMCLCVDQKPPIPVAVAADGRILSKATGMALTVSSVAACEERYLGRVLGFDAQALLDKLHYLSAGMVSFARGLNDTPKIAALTMAGIGVGVSLGSALLAVGIAMALGGILSARKVATTMSDKIVTMNPGQGMTANVVTALLVTVASRFGVPVSTTHVSCGSLFGLGAATGEARWGVIRNIILAWIITLPLGAGLAALVAITFY